MHEGKLVFAQLMLYLRLSTFRRCVANHRGEHKVKDFSCLDLYRQRWQLELFFKWIKQHLRVTVFSGTSENAVKTQIWIAISTYALIAIAKKRLHLDHHSPPCANMTCDTYPR